MDHHVRLDTIVSKPNSLCFDQVFQHSPTTSADLSDLGQIEVYESKCGELLPINARKVICSHSSGLLKFKPKELQIKTNGISNKMSMSSVTPSMLIEKFLILNKEMLDELEVLTLDHPTPIHDLPIHTLIFHGSIKKWFHLFPKGLKTIKVLGKIDESLKNLFPNLSIMNI